MKMQRFSHRPTAKEAEKYGKAAENRFVRECEERLENGLFPEWVLSIRHATPEEDEEGIDVWFTTDVGQIAIQIKRSHHERTKFLARENRRHIACIVVSPHSHFNSIFAFTLSTLRQERQKLIRAQAPS